MSEPESGEEMKKIDLSGSLQPHEVNGLRQKTLDPRDFVALSLVGSKTAVVGIDVQGSVVLHLEVRVPADVLEGFKKQVVLLATGGAQVPDVARQIPFSPEVRLLLPTATLTLNAQRQMDASLLLQRQNLGASLAAQVRKQQQAQQTQQAAPAEAPASMEASPSTSSLEGKVWTSFVYDEDNRTWTMGFTDGTSARCKLMAQVVNPPMYESPDAAPLRAKISEGATGQTIEKVDAAADPVHGNYAALKLSDGSEICIVPL